MTTFVGTVAVIDIDAITATTFSFIAVGDMPYGNEERTWFETKLPEAIAAEDVPFVVHYGDIKSGGDACSDELIRQSRDAIYALHSQVFFTPGDNEWTDCDRTEQTSELERLSFLRQEFFNPKVLPQGLYHRQHGYPENVRWWSSGVLFATLHVVGTNNGRSQVLQDEIETALARVEARDQANLDWLNQVFQEAEIYNAQAIVLTMQADITARQNKAACTVQNPSDCNGFAPYQTQLTQAAAEFRRADQSLKPVLVIHGDTDPFCLDNTMGGETAPNLWRLNAWGDFLRPMDVTEVTVQLDQAERPFRVQTLMHQVSPETSC